MGMDNKSILGVGALLITAFIVGAGVTGNIPYLSAADEPGEDDGLEDLRDVRPDLIFNLASTVDNGTFYMASEEMEDFGHYVDFEGEGADKERTIDSSDEVLFPGWRDPGLHYAAVTADGYHTAFAEVNIDSRVDEDAEELQNYDFYDGAGELEKKATVVEDEVMITDEGDNVATTTYADYADGDGVIATFEVDEGVAYLGEVSIDTSEEVEFTVTVDGETVEEIDGETVDESEDFELGDGEDLFKAYDEIVIEIDGYESMGQSVTVDNIYEEELFNLSVEDAA